MDKKFLYEKIYCDLLEAIRSGTYKEGDCLPSEKKLAENYGASRITSKKAMEMLAEQGMITRTPGRGSFVTKPCVPEASKHLPDAGTPACGGQKIIGVILDSFGCDFGTVLLKSIEQECRKNNYVMMLHCTYGSLEEENKAIRNAVEMGADGLLLICAQNESYNTTIIQLSLKHYPMVLLDRQMKGISIPCIKTDNYLAARELTSHLVRNGHKKICFVSHAFTGTSTIRERYDGFVDGIMGNDTVNGKIVEIPLYNPIPENGPDQEEDLLRSEIRRVLREQEECSAFFCVEYKLGILIEKEAKAMKLSKEIVAFDGLDGAFGECSFVHVKQNEWEIGRKAVNVLCELIRGESVNGNINVPFEIIRPDRELQEETRNDI